MNIYETYISYTILLAITLVILVCLYALKRGYSISQFMIDREYTMYLYNDLLMTHLLASQVDILDFEKATGINGIKYEYQIFTFEYKKYKIRLCKKFDSLFIKISDEDDYREYTFNPYLPREYILKDEYGRNLKTLLQGVYRYFL